MSTWYAQQAKQNPDLFRVIFDFNRRPQHWVHPEVLSTLPHANIVQALSTTNRGSSHVATWLTRELKLDAAEVCWDFEEPRRRLALLNAGTLRKLACYAGAASCWPRIATTISRDELREIKTAIGEEAHVFALRRGRMIMPEQEALAPSKDQSLADQVLDQGWRMVAAAALDEHPAVQQRFTLKLPPAVAQSLANQSAAALDVRTKAWQRLRKISPEVLTEGETKCFA